jgi:hypothetical protein
MVKRLVELSSFRAAQSNETGILTNEKRLQKINAVFED